MPGQTPRPLVAQAADADDLRELLAAVVEVLTPPYAATVGGEEVRSKILDDRLAVTLAVLEGVIAPDRPHWDSIPENTAFLRGAIAQYPAVGYVTQDVARARREAGMDYMASVTPQTAEEGAQG